MKFTPHCLTLLGLILGLQTAPAHARDEGVVLYEHEDFRGRQVLLRSDARDLNGLPVSNDRASSIRVDRGCVAILYADEDFRGRSIEVRGDVADLGRTPIGNDRLSSIEVNCRGGWSEGRRDRVDRRRDRRDEQDDWRGRRGVILYEDEGFRGRSEFFDRDTDSLVRSRIGNDRVSSVRVSPGCQVTLFENERFYGDSSALERDEPSLSRTRIGNDRTSSLTVRCAGRGGNTGSDYGWGEGIVIYADADFSGRSENFTRDVRDFKRTSIGNDRASSIRLARGCVAWLYQDADFRGAETRISGDVENLGNTRLGNDRLSSMRLECRGRRY
ncbi:MAG: beta/gamma crystallin-related protein [Acidobacteriota bacterium]